MSATVFLKLENFRFEKSFVRVCFLFIKKYTTWIQEKPDTHWDLRPLSICLFQEIDPCLAIILSLFKVPCYETICPCQLSWQAFWNISKACLKVRSLAVPLMVSKPLILMLILSTFSFIRCTWIIIQNSSFVRCIRIIIQISSFIRCIWNYSR